MGIDFGDCLQEVEGGIQPILKKIAGFYWRVSDKSLFRTSAHLTRN